MNETHEGIPISRANSKLEHSVSDEVEAIGRANGVRSIADLHRAVADHDSALLTERFPISELRVDADRIVVRDREFRLNLSGIRRLCKRFRALNALTRVATHSLDLAEWQRNRLARLAGIYANQDVHLCPHCFSILTSS
jgi:hypothetical protein